MAYKRDMRAAAQRHYKDAAFLQKHERYNNAGYHYGLAAECALKAVFIMLGERNITSEAATDAIYFDHFPALKGKASLFLAGRLSQTLAATLARGSFMAEWHITLRYAKDHCITKDRCEHWERDANEFLTACARIGV